MNKKLLYSTIACAMLSFTSCNDFLDVEPPSGFTPGYVFTSEEEAKALMTKMYSAMTEDGMYGSTLANSLNTNTDVEMSSFKNNTVAAKRLVDEYQTSVLIKGGHLEGDRMCDLLHTSESIFHIYEEKKIESNNLHGTGCTLSSAIATNLAKGYPLRESIQHAKSYITQAIIAGKDLHIGHGNGPLWHFPDSVAQICTFCAVVS